MPESDCDCRNGPNGSCSLPVDWQTTTNLCWANWVHTTAPCNQPMTCPVGLCKAHHDEICQ